MSRSPFQRFINELRRRHVPQTAAIYLVAAWAAIEFADVVVPNLNGPQWVVTAVIVAALVGFPVMLVVAWVFEWGPEGIHRTESEARTQAEIGRGDRPDARTVRSQPWLAAVAVLVVGIGSAVAVTYVLRGTEPEATAPAGDTSREGQADRQRGAREPGEPPVVPDVPIPAGGEYGVGVAESVRAQLTRAFSALDSIDIAELTALGRRAALEAGLGVVVAEPAAWRYGGSMAPVPLAEGDTLVVEGAAMDTAGVAVITVDGEAVAEADPPEPTLPFTATLVGTASAGTRTVVITARTADGQEIRREYTISQLPGGTP